MFRCVLIHFDQLGPKQMPVSSIVCISTENEGSKTSIIFSKRLHLVLLLGYKKVFYDTGFRILKACISGARSWADGFRQILVLQSNGAFSLCTWHGQRGMHCLQSWKRAAVKPTGLLDLNNLKKGMYQGEIEKWGCRKKKRSSHGK